jgi:two-component system, response regulator YesN
VYKVLLVDDERIILQGISNVIEWGSLGTILAGTARNGKEAYDFIVRERPDIVISDIKMPGMDGLQLVSKTYENMPATRFILLSGFGEFDFARTAMKYGVKHYLLKPCNENQIMDALKDLTNELNQRKQMNAYLEKMSTLIGGDSVKGMNDTLRNDHQNKNKHSAVIRKVIEIIDQHLSNPELSLNGVASQMLYMNADYLGKLFKKETGERFSNYVTKERVKKAMEHIELTGDVKIFELADMFGFGDNPQYFSQVFKKHTGFTPSEYRKSYDAISTDF